MNHLPASASPCLPSLAAKDPLDLVMEHDLTMTASGPFCYVNKSRGPENMVIPPDVDPCAIFHSILAQQASSTIARAPVPRRATATLVPGSKAREAHVRADLRLLLERAHKASHIVDELVVYSTRTSARIDVAVFDQQLHGYEIKSEADTLVRLARQREVYSATFDFVTLVIDSAHIKHLVSENEIPRWWGVIQVTRTSRGTLRLHQCRKPLQNTSIDASAFVRILWQSELKALLDTNGVAYPRRHNNTTLREAAVSALPFSTIHDQGLALIKARNTWRKGA